jgi:hypothetical protein
MSPSKFVALRGQGRVRYVVLATVVVALLLVSGGWWLTRRLAVHSVPTPEMIIYYPDRILGITTDRQLMFLHTYQGLVLQHIASNAQLRVIRQAHRSYGVHTYFAWQPDRRWLYFINNNQLWSAFVENPSNAAIYSQKHLNLELYETVATTETLYALTHERQTDERQIVVLDARQPRYIQRAAFLNGSDGARTLALDGKRLYVGFDDRVCRYRIDDPRQPQLSTCWSLPEALTDEQALLKLFARVDELIVVTKQRVITLDWSTEQPTVQDQFESEIPLGAAAFNATVGQLYVGEASECNEAIRTPLTVQALNLNEQGQIIPKTNFEVRIACIISLQAESLGLIVMGPPYEEPQIALVTRLPIEKKVNFLPYSFFWRAPKLINTTGNRLDGVIGLSSDAAMIISYDPRTPQLMNNFGIGSPFSFFSGTLRTSVYDISCLATTPSASYVIDRQGHFSSFSPRQALMEAVMDRSNESNLDTPVDGCALLADQTTLMTFARQRDPLLWKVDGDRAPVRLASAPACPAIAPQVENGNMPSLRVVSAYGWVAVLDPEQRSGACLYDVHTTSSPRLVHTPSQGDNISDIAITAQRIYLLHRNGLDIYQIESDGRLSLKHTIDSIQGDEDTLTTDGRILIAHSYEGNRGLLRIYDLRQIDQPRLIAADEYAPLDIDRDLTFYDTALAGSYYYFAGGGLAVYNLGPLLNDDEAP